MKRQFVYLHTLPGKEYHSEQKPLTHEKLLADTPPGIPSIPPQARLPSQVRPNPAGTGLLSSWKSRQLQESRLVLNRTSSSIAEQETWKQAVVQVQAPKQRRFPIWARACIILLTVILVLLGSGLYYYNANFATPIGNIVNQQVARLKGDADPNQARDASDILSGGRINILLLGSDNDEKFHGDYLAQTDIVVTIDPATGSVGMLSLPRDTWLNAPGYGMMKLDQVYGRGGIALSRLTIYQDFGIPINYYAWVGLAGFIKVIDTVGGIDVDVMHPIADDNYPDDISHSGKDIYALKRLYLAPGPQHLNGPQALEYVRSRHADLVGDFGRSTRQQQVLTQLKLKLNNPDILSKLPELANDLNGYVKTDMQLADVLKLMNFARTVNQNKINRVILDTYYTRQVDQFPTDFGPQSVVILNCAAVQPVIAKMFDLGDKALCNTGI